MTSLPVAVGAATLLALVWSSRIGWSRWRFLRTPGAFACRLRPAGPLEGPGRPRRMRHARWVHDVLLVHRGPALVRCDVLAVANLTGPVLGDPERGLGLRPVHLRLQLDDGRVLDLVARNGDVTAAIGPFVAASLL